MKEGNTVLDTSQITHPRTQCHFPKYLNASNPAVLTLDIATQIVLLLSRRSAPLHTMSVNCMSSCNEDMRVQRCEWAASDVLSTVTVSTVTIGLWPCDCPPARPVVTRRHQHSYRNSFEQETF